MYPLIRLAFARRAARNLPPMGLFDTHETRLMCWPQDIDPWVELNNGRTLTLYDLGRVPLINRIGLRKTIEEKGWGFAVAGTSIRYRRRVKMFDRLTMLSRVAGWDSRFFYVDQSMWRKGECTSQALIRLALSSPAGIVPPATLVELAGLDSRSPQMPDWINAWAEAETRRPWPPEMAPPAKN